MVLRIRGFLIFMSLLLLFMAVPSRIMAAPDDIPAGLLRGYYPSGNAFFKVTDGDSSTSISLTTVLNFTFSTPQDIGRFYLKHSGLTTMKVFFINQSGSVIAEHQTGTGGGVVNLPIKAIGVSKISLLNAGANYPTLYGFDVYEIETLPTNVKINSFTAYHDRIALNYSGTDVSEYEIYRDGVLIDTVQSSSYVVTGLSPLTSYVFHVVGKNSFGSLSSSQITVKTKEPPPPPVFKDFRVFEVMDKSLRMSFSFLDVDRHFVYANGVLVDTLPKNATSYVMKTDPLTTYKLKIVAENAYGETSSNEIEVTTLEELVLPYDLNLSVSNVLPDRVDMDVSVKKAKTIKFYRDNRLINTISGDIKVYTDNTVDSDREYTYKFVAENQLGTVTSNELKVKTLRPPAMEVPDVFITPGSKGFLDSITFTIASHDPDATLFYSFDGVSWQKYESPITLKESKEVYAKAKNVLGVESGIVANKYVLQDQPKVQLGVHIRDVARASESHFNVIWPIVAFLVGVVSALYIARNTRDLF